jgi:hypothetical protein
MQTANCRLRADRLLATLSLALCILVSALARPAGAQSFFNSRGLGELTGTADARLAALGDPLALSTQNPGILVNLPRTSFHATVLGAAVLGNQSGSERLLRDVRPGLFDLASPLPWKMRVFGGLSERFNQDFDVWSESMPDTAYRRHITGRGGIYSLRTGLARSMFDRLCLGAEYRHILGGSRETWRFEMLNGGQTSTDTIEVDYDANTFRLGASYQTSVFSLAGYYEPGFKLTVNRYLRVHGVIRDSQVVYRLSIPHSYSLAAAVNPLRNLGLDLGLSVYPWQDASINRLPLAPYTDPLDYGNVWRGSAGVEYDIDSLHPVRLGYSRQTWYYDAASVPELEPTHITENGIHLGTSLPIRGFGALNVSGELLFRNSHAIRETAGRLTLTLAYAEPWMKRTRRWGY